MTPLTGRNPAWHVGPGYEDVADAFVASSDMFGDGGASFCVLHRGEPILDLWGGTARPGEPWERDTLAVLMSVTKGLAGVCLMILVDRGQLSLDDLVTKHWPEYGQAGKERTTVEMVLMHTCGALGLPGRADLIGWDGSGFDRYDDIAARLAASPPVWEPGTKQGYHALTYGWLVGELIRRITGRTLGQFFHDEVAVPLGLDTWIGTPSDALPRVARLIDIGYHAIPAPMRAQVAKALNATRDPRTLNGQAFFGDGETSGVEQLPRLLNMDEVLATEFPSGNGTSTARSLARVFALLAAGGTLDGVRLFSEETSRTFDAVTSSMPDELAREAAVTRAQRRAAEAPFVRIGPHLANVSGRVALPDTMGPNPKAAGAAGFGGQLVFFDKENDLVVAYLRSHLVALDAHCPQLVERVYRAAVRNGDVDASRVRSPGIGRRMLQRPLRSYVAHIERKSLTAPR